MPRGALEVGLKIVISKIADELQPLGFERHGTMLKSVEDGNALLLDFQRSDTSTKERILFTINLGVVCGDLLDRERTSISKATILNAHLRTRLGALLDPPGEIWWAIDASTDNESLATELVHLLVRRAVPYLFQYKQTQALIALWETGKSPGLTASQRTQFLSELKAN